MIGLIKFKIYFEIIIIINNHNHAKPYHRHHRYFRYNYCKSFICANICIHLYQNNPPKTPCDLGFYCSKVIVEGGNQCISCSAGKYADTTDSTPTADGCKNVQKGNMKTKLHQGRVKNVKKVSMGILRNRHHVANVQKVDSMIFVE